MRSSEGFLHLLYLAPLLAAASVLPGATESPIGPGLVFALLAAYARIVSLVSDATGLEEALLFAELLPFFAYCEALAGGLGLGPALLATALAACAGAALLSIESLVRVARRSSLAAAAFIAAAAAAGFAMDRAGAASFLGGCAIVMAVCAYARRRGA